MLRIHHIRNATMVIEIDNNFILVDPMLGDKASMPSYTKDFLPQKNPIVSLPETSAEVLKKVTHCLITHQHSDHLDKTGEHFLTVNKIPVTCSYRDSEEFKRRGLIIDKEIKYWKKTNYINGTIEGIPAQHGYGEVAELMGNVMGYFMILPNRKSIYLSSDTIYTNDVHHVLKEYQPDISIVACGSAKLDDYEPILMTFEDIIKFIKDAPGKVIANHLEAVNHCPTTRKELKDRLKYNDLLDKTWIPNDGEYKDL